jgi:Tfp pilus assembly protein PilO
MNRTPSRITLDLLGFGACASMLVGAYMFGVRTWLEASARNERITVESTTLAHDTEVRAKTHRAVRDSLESIRAGLAAEGVTLASTTDLTGRLIEIGALARDGGLAVETLSPRPLEPGDGFDRQPIALRCTGRYPDCVRLLAAIREADATIAARSVNVRRATADGVATLDAELVWFVQASPAGG